MKIILAAQEFKKRFPDTWESFSEAQRRHVVYAMIGWASQCELSQPQQGNKVSENDVVKKFTDQVLDHNIDLEFVDIVNKNFWDLLPDEINQGNGVKEKYCGNCTCTREVNEHGTGAYKCRCGYVFDLPPTPQPDQEKEECKTKDVDFRKYIAEELTRDELIDRLCELHEQYMDLREKHLFPEVIWKQL